MERKLLVLGIDPGTTAAYALLSLEGKLIGIGSSKGESINDILFKASSYGRIVVVASDKAKAPFAVSKAAASVGARLFLPKEDLTHEEKRILGKGFDAKNDHEMDAIAAARHALNAIRPRIEKAQIAIEKYSNGILIEKLKESMIKKENISPLHEIEKIIESSTPINPKKLDNAQIALKADTDSKEGMQNSKDSATLQKENEKLSSLAAKFERENQILRKSNERLRQEISEISGSLSLPGEVISKEGSKEIKLRKIIKFKEKRLIKQAREISMLRNSLHDMSEAYEKSAIFIADMSKDEVLIKKLDSLSFEEVSKKADKLKIKSEDYLFVENIEGTSDASLRFLKNRVKCLIFTQKNKMAERYIPCIYTNQLHIRYNSYFAIAKRKELENALSKLDLISRVVNEYREERDNF